MLYRNEDSNKATNLASIQMLARARCAACFGGRVVIHSLDHSNCAVVLRLQ